MLTFLIFPDFKPFWGLKMVGKGCEIFDLVEHFQNGSKFKVRIRISQIFPQNSFCTIFLEWPVLACDMALVISRVTKQPALTKFFKFIPIV